MDLKSTIRSVPDFPKKGILFYDITTLLKDPAALKESIDQLASHYQNAGIEVVAGIESRGFIFGTPLAYHLGAGYVPVRKPAPIR
jgi:adenine phosphoribosyltransferase